MDLETLRPRDQMRLMTLIVKVNQARRTKATVDNSLPTVKYLKRTDLSTMTVTELTNVERELQEARETILMRMREELRVLNNLILQRMETHPKEAR